MCKWRFNVTEEWVIFFSKLIFEITKVGKIRFIHEKKITKGF